MDFRKQKKVCGFMMIETLATGDELHRYNRCLVAKFNGRRNVLSTSMHNGGYRENLTAVYNRDVNPGPGRPCEELQPGQEERTKVFINEELGLDYETVANMATIVSMESAGIRTETYDILTVSVVSTASLEVNGGRVGEPATSYEKNGNYINLRPGTINIMVFVNDDMTPGCMARAMVTATEAKTAAIQELMGGSLYSTGLATGSGTDNMMIIADAESENQLTYAGKHGKLGELIARLVMETVKESLGKHMDLSPESQHSCLARLKRYGVGEKSFCQKFNQLGLSGQFHLADVIDQLHRFDRDKRLLPMVSLYIHLLDQLDWGLIICEEAMDTGKAVLEKMVEKIGGKVEWKNGSIDQKKECIEKMLESLVETLLCSLIAAMEA
jgi:adenosylcobinamide amidohydrolase